MSTLTHEQLNRLRVELEPGSRVLCLTCAERHRSRFNDKTLQVIGCLLDDFLAECLVQPDEDWNCPRCHSSLVDGISKGTCPNCGNEGRRATRKRWICTVDCNCVKTADQRKADANAARAREDYYDREDRPAREREAARAAAEEEAQAQAGLRAKAATCLAEMPKSGCTYPANNLPWGTVCEACPRFDKASKPAQANRKGNLEQPQPKTSTPLRDPGSFATRPGFKENVAMRDEVADAFGNW